jgi:hypothetical protein
MRLQFVAIHLQIIIPYKYIDSPKLSSNISSLLSCLDYYLEEVKKVEFVKKGVINEHY